MNIAICPILHPAYILRGQHQLEPFQLDYLERCRQYVRGTHEIVDISVPAPSAIMYPTLEDLADFRRGGDFTEGVAIDIEAAGEHIICIGFTRVSDLAYVCLRFRTRGGGLYWPTFKQLLSAVTWADEILGNPSIPLGFHNGQSYDVPALLKLGFRVAGFCDHPKGWDTFLAHKTALAGLPAGLQNCATVHLGFPLWKTLVKEDDEEAEGK